MISVKSFLIFPVAVLTAATLVVGVTFAAATGQSAYAFQKKGDKGNGNNNGNTVTIQKCKQAATQSGWDNDQEQECENLICTHPGNNSTCTEEGVTTTTARAAQAPPRTCEECFKTILTQTQLMNVLGSDRSLEQFCAVFFNTPGGRSEAEFREGLIEDNVTPAQADALIACLKAVGIVFRP